MFQVSVVRCNDYEEKAVYKAVRKAVELIGGLEQFNFDGQPVLLKPNLLLSKPLKKAVITHPVVIKVVADLVREAGGNPVVGDNPGVENVKRVMERAEVKKICSLPLVEFKNFVPFKKKSKEDIFKNLFISKEVLDFPFIINLPKVKTHTYMKLTLGIKNLFGVVSKKGRIEWHLKTGQHKGYFALMLVELFEAIKPQLTIVDSIVGMEGDGPSGGKAKPIGLILAGQNGHSVDRIIAEILGIGDDLFTLQAALKKKIEGVRLEEVEILGERIEEVKLTSFKLPRTETGIGLPIPPFLRWFLKKFLVVRPVIKESLCQKCKVCLKICPPQAISQENGRLKINDTVCLRCFCCQELCRYNAIVIKRGFLPLK